MLAGLVDGGGLLCRRWAPVEEFQGLFRSGQDPGVATAGGRVGRHAADTGEESGVPDSSGRLVGVGEVPEEQGLAEIGGGLFGCFTDQGGNGVVFVLGFGRATRQTGCARVGFEEDEDTPVRGEGPRTVWRALVKP